MAITNITEALEALRDLATSLPEAGGDIPVLDLASMGFHPIHFISNQVQELVVPLSAANADIIRSIPNGSNMIAKLPFALDSSATTIVTIPTMGTICYMEGYGHTLEISLGEGWIMGCTLADGDTNLSYQIRWLVNGADLQSEIYNHDHAASKITAGTFAGQVVAKSSTQAPATMLLRNSKLSTTEANPSNNGEIVWQYS